MSALPALNAGLRRVAVLDTETAGFPRNATDNSGRLLELAAYCVDMDTRALVGRQFHVLHLPSNWAEVRERPDIQKALSLSGTDLAGDVERHGQSGPAVQRQWEAWATEHGVQAVAAFNSAFDGKIVPWITLPWLRCLMKWSGEIIQTRLPPGTCVNAAGHKKRPKLSEAQEHLTTLGVRFPTVAGAHRAPYDAFLTAHVLTGLCWLDPHGVHLER